MNPRYFIGIALPGVLTQKIERLQQKILIGENVMTPLLPHITLLHPTILMTLSPLYFLPLVKEVASQTLPVSIELTKTAMFDNRVLYIDVKSPKLLDLHEQMVELLPPDVRARYQIGRKFTPHVTIAQAKPLQALSDDIVSQLNGELTPIIPTKFVCESLQQFLQVKPREYTIKSIT